MTIATRPPILGTGGFVSFGFFALRLPKGTLRKQQGSKNRTVTQTPSAGAVQRLSLRKAESTHHYGSNGFMPAFIESVSQKTGLTILPSATAQALPHSTVRTPSALPWVIGYQPRKTERRPAPDAPDYTPLRPLIPKRLIARINLHTQRLTHLRYPRIMRATWLHSSVG